MTGSVTCAARAACLDCGAERPQDHRSLFTAGPSRLAVLVLGLGILGSANPPVLAQAANQITAVSPASAAQGTTGLLVTFTLDTDVPPAPPAGILPTSVKLAAMTGASATHSSQYTVTAVFSIPGSEPTGAKDCVIEFTTPNGTLTFSRTGGFTVTSAPNTPPSITQQPQPQTVYEGASATFTVVASGTAPLATSGRRISPISTAPTARPTRSAP